MSNALDLADLGLLTGGYGEAESCGMGSHPSQLR